MVKEIGKDFYVLPGGMVENGETPLQALHRELAEELATKVKNVQLFGEYDLPSKDSPETLHFIVFKGNLEGQPQITSDIVSIAWLDNNYQREEKKVGSITSLRLFPELKQLALIG